MPLVFGSSFPLFSEGVVDRKVFGTVLSAAGVAQVDITVQIDMETLDGGTVSIGEAETDSDGRYELTFDPEDFNPQIMRVSLSGVSGTPSQVVAAPAWNEEVNFRLGTLAGARVARFTDVSRRLSEVLAPSQTDVADLDTVGVARASVLAGIPPAETALWREALISSDLSEVPDTLFFALGQAGLSAAVASATKHSPHDWSLALQRAAAMGILSPEDQTVAQEALADLTDVMIDSALQTPTLIANPGQALTLAGITDPELRKETLAAWVSSNGDPVTFWSGVSGLSAGEKEDVQFALHLDKITRSNAPMVAALFGDYDSLEELGRSRPQRLVRPCRHARRTIFSLRRDEGSVRTGDVQRRGGCVSDADACGEECWASPGERRSPRSLPAILSGTLHTTSRGSLFDSSSSEPP
jgi:hypothetical protein